MNKTEDHPDMKILKTSTCKTISAKSTLTYQIGTEDDEIHVRITKNTGGGFFSDEWISLIDIRSVLDEHPEGTPVTSFILQTLFHGKSVNTPAFLLAALAHEKLLHPIHGKKRSLEPAEDFTEKVSKLMTSKGTARSTSKKSPSSTRKKTVTKKAVSKKATVKKRSAIRRKKATT